MPSSDSCLGNGRPQDAEVLRPLDLGEDFLNEQQKSAILLGSIACGCAPEEWMAKQVETVASAILDGLRKDRE
jgi:hypothetical protein